jgi:biopolymer transport protein ExbD
MYPSRQRRKKPELNSNINMTNLVDVVLTILIIFILVAPFIEQGIPIALPKSETKQNVPTHELTIKVTRDRNIYIGSVRVTEQELEKRLRSIAAAKPDITVNLQGDGRTDYQAIVDVLDIVRRSGITSIGLATEVKVED